MFKTILFTTLLMGTAIAHLRDFPDRDALFLAQKDNNNTGEQMDPPKEVYDTIHKELEVIRKAYPQLAHIHVNSESDGRIICSTGAVDLERLNSSDLGPIKVDNIGNGQGLITFEQPFQYLYLDWQIMKHYELEGKNSACHGLLPLGATQDIVEFNHIYAFITKSVNCFVECRREHHWWIRIKDLKIDHVREWDVDLDQVSTTSAPKQSTTGKPNTTVKI